MASLFQRLSNRFNIFAIASLVLGAGMNIVLAFAPNIVSTLQAKLIVIAGIAFIIIATVLFIVGFIKTRHSTKSDMPTPQQHQASAPLGQGEVWISARKIDNRGGIIATGQGAKTTIFSEDMKNTGIIRADTIGNSQPDVVYNSQDRQAYMGHCYIRLVFKNQVITPLAKHSTSQDTRAHIWVYTNTGDLIDDWDGRWADSEYPATYGDILRLNKLDIIANDTAKLDIGARAIGHVQFKGHYNRHAESPEPQRKLLEHGSYYIRTDLWAANMAKRETWFTLEVPDVPQSNDLAQVKITPTTKPAFGK